MSRFHSSPNEMHFPFTVSKYLYSSNKVKPTFQEDQYPEDYITINFL